MKKIEFHRSLRLCHKIQYILNEMDWASKRNEWNSKNLNTINKVKIFVIGLRRSGASAVLFGGNFSKVSKQAQICLAGQIFGH